MPKRLAENSPAQVDMPWPFSVAAKKQQLEQNAPKPTPPAAAPVPAAEADPNAAEVQRLIKEIHDLGGLIVEAGKDLSSLGRRIIAEADPTRLAFFIGERTKLEAQQATLVVQQEKLEKQLAELKAQLAGPSL